MKVRFLITAKDPHVITEKGVRVFVMERLLNSSFEKGSVTNLDEKTVEVRIEGDEEQIKQFKEELRKAIPAKFGNPTISLLDTQAIPTAELPQLMKSSQALMIGQLSKGIDVQLHILETLKTMNRELPTQIAKAIKEN